MDETWTEIDWDSAVDPTGGPFDPKAIGPLTVPFVSATLMPLREPWTCTEPGWYVYANGTFTKVADADEDL